MKWKLWMAVLLALLCCENLDAGGGGGRGQLLGQASKFQEEVAQEAEGEAVGSDDVGEEDQGVSVPGRTVSMRIPPQRDFCIKRAYPLKGINSDWNNVKWIDPPARCTVQGFPIEDLQSAFNFRRGWALGYSKDLEDKTHILPYMRASADLSLHSRRRRVLLDLGGSYFETSTMWFLRMYPLEFTEIYTFEFNKGVFKIPPPSDREFSILDTMNNQSQVTSEDRAFLPNHVLDRITLIEKLVGMYDHAGSPTTPPSVNITRFIKDELKLTAFDTVIVKMDIEGEEWSVLPFWLKDPEMPDIIDEIFVEIHYHDKSMSALGWDRFLQTRNQAIDLLANMRSGRFFIHPWP